MEEYSNSTAKQPASLLLSQFDSGLTDEIHLGKIVELLHSRIENLMPQIQVAGPTSQWLETYFTDNKVQTLSADVDVFRYDLNPPTLDISQELITDIKKMYSFDVFLELIKGYSLTLKNNKLTEEFYKILTDPATATDVGNIPTITNANAINDLTIAKSKVQQVIAEFKNDLQLSEVEIGIACHPDYAFLVDELNNYQSTRAFYDVRLDKFYIFIAKTSTSYARTSFGLYNYSDSIRRWSDFDTSRYYWRFINRSAIVLNPLNEKIPMVRALSVA